MTRNDFLTAMQDVLQRDEALSFEMKLKDIEEWDSLSMMATMAFLEKSFGIKTNITDYRSMKTLEDIAKKAGL